MMKSRIIGDEIMEDCVMYKNVRKKSDGTYIVDAEGIDYHVAKDYPPEGAYTYDKVHAYAAANPDKVSDYEEKPLFITTREEELLQELELIDKTYRTARIMSNAAIGDEFAAEQLKTAEILAKPLRDELKELKKNTDNS